MNKWSCSLVSSGFLLALSLSPALAATSDTTILPADIDPVSLSRLPLADRNDMDAEGQRVYDMVIGPNPAAPMIGPGGISQHSTKIAEAMHILNSYLRGEGVLGPRYTEVAILVAAWEIEQQYEWSAHEPAALRFGVPVEVIDTIKYDREIENLSAKESLIIRFGRQLLRENKLDSELWAEAVEFFGQQGALEMAALIGDYVMAGIMLHAVNQHLPPEREALLPPR